MKRTTQLAQVRESTWQITAASRRPGRERVIHRIQGFVAGATLIFGLQTIQYLIFKDPDQIKATAWATAFLAALVYAAIVVSIDRNEKEPWQMLLASFLWGVVISSSMAGLLNTIWRNLIGPNLVKGGLIDGLFSVAPYTEEIAKGAILFLIFWYASKEFDNALDGIIYGAMVGIGFAMTENAGYFFRKAPSTEIVEQMRTGQFFLRVVLKGLAGHATYTAITGLGLGLSRQRQRRWLKIVLPMLGLAIAMLAHALWNSATIQDMLDLTSIQSGPWRTATRVALINGPFFVGAIIAVVLSWRKEARVIIEQLANELDPNDPYTAPVMMYTVRDRFRARWRTLWARGVSTWWTLRQLQRTWIELAFCKRSGQEEDAVRQRIELLRSHLAS